LDPDVDRDQAIRAYLGRSWDEVEADSASYIAQAETEVAEWAWVAQSETLWEVPQPLAGDEGRLRILSAEPSPEERASAVLLGYGANGDVIVARYFTDHWEGRDGGTRYGGVSIESVRVSGVLLRFRHERRGRHQDRVVLGSLVRGVYDDDGRLGEVWWWFGGHHAPEAKRTAYIWAGSRLRCAIEESFDRDLDDLDALRDRTRIDYEYDDRGLLRVRWTTEHNRFFADSVGDSGVSWFRRSPKALRAARKLIDTELPDRIRAWVARVAPAEPLYGLGIVHSIDAPELPPALGLGTVAELRAWRAKHDDLDEFRTYAWNPAEFRHFDPLPAELTGPALDDAYALLNQDWQLSESETEPRATLRRCARRLLQVDWAEVGAPAEDFVVFVVEDEIGDDLLTQLHATIPRHVLRRVEALRRAR
jgi:hypothetical protein